MDIYYQNLAIVYKHLVALPADYAIPRGSFVVPFLSAVHLDENVYEDPRSFNPWRWMKPENQVIHL